MSKHPLNLAFRFLLEIVALVSIGIWGYTSFEGGTGVIAAIFFPLMFAITWGVFAVKGDPSRSGKTVVPTPGSIRLILELVLFGLAVVALMAAGYKLLSVIFGGVVLIHYLLSIDRILWLVKRKE